MAEEWNRLRSRGKRSVDPRTGPSHIHKSSTKISSFIQNDSHLPQFVRIFIVRILSEFGNCGELKEHDPYSLFEVPYNIFVKFSDVYIDDATKLCDFTEWFCSAISDPSYLRALDRREAKIVEIIEWPYWAFWALLSRRTLVDDLLLGRYALRSTTLKSLSNLHDESLEALIGNAAASKDYDDWLIHHYADMCQEFPELSDITERLVPFKQVHLVKCIREKSCWRWLARGAKPTEFKTIVATLRAPEFAVLNTAGRPARSTRMLHKQKRRRRTSSPRYDPPPKTTRSKRYSPEDSQRRVPLVETGVEYESHQVEARDGTGVSSFGVHHRHDYDEGMRTPLRRLSPPKRARRSRSKRLDGISDDATVMATAPEKLVTNVGCGAICPFPCCARNVVDGSSIGTVQGDAETWFLSTCFKNTGLGTVEKDVKITSLTPKAAIL